MFVIRDFRQGGVPRCLQSLLHVLDTKQYQVQLFCLHYDGPYKNKMPNCEVLPEDWLIRSLMTFRRDASLKDFWVKLVWKIVKSVFHWDLLQWRFQKIASRISCDTAIAYTEAYPAQFVSFVDAHKKLVWIHNDYQWVGSVGQGTPFSIFDKIVCVSECTRQSFVKLYPHLREKTAVLHNITNVSYIRQKAEEPIDDTRFETNLPVIVSLGRVCAQKYFDAIPQIARELKQRLSFRWYIIGGGPQDEESVVRKEISQCGVEDCVIMLGAHNNPYNYLSKAAVFVLTSRYESYPTVINEALVLGVPVVARDIPSAYEMMIDNDGVICPLDEMPEKILQVLKSHKDISFRDENESILCDFNKLVE